MPSYGLIEASAEEALREFLHDVGQHVVVDAAQHRHFGAFAVELGDELA